MGSETFTKIIPCRPIYLISWISSVEWCQCHVVLHNVMVGPLASILHDSVINILSRYCIVQTSEIYIFSCVYIHLCIQSVHECIKTALQGLFPTIYRYTGIYRYNGLN